MSDIVVAPQNSWTQALLDCDLAASSHSPVPNRCAFHWTLPRISHRVVRVFLFRLGAWNHPCDSGLSTLSSFPDYLYLIIPSVRLLRRAEVVLGNIIKKKGWRYEAHFNWVWCFLISVPASLPNLVSSPSLHILGGRVLCAGKVR